MLMPDAVSASADLRSKPARSPTVSASSSFVGSTGSCRRAPRLAADAGGDRPIRSDGIRDICGGTATVFDAAHEAGLRRVVWASSVAVFGARGEYPPGRPRQTMLATDPLRLYGSCKSLCENLARRAFRRWSRRRRPRLSVVYGAGRLRGYMSYPSHLMRRAALGEPVHIPWGRQRMHWQYVEEVADMVAMHWRRTARRRSELQHPRRLRGAGLTWPRR